MSLAAATALAAAGDLSPNTTTNHTSTLSPTISPTISPTPGAVFRVNDDTHVVEYDRDATKKQLFHRTDDTATSVTSATSATVTTATATTALGTSTEQKGVPLCDSAEGGDDDVHVDGQKDNVRAIAEEAAQLLRASVVPVRTATQSAGPSPGPVAVPKPGPSPVPIRSPSPMSVSYPGTIATVAPSSSKANNKTATGPVFSTVSNIGGDGGSRSGTNKGPDTAEAIASAAVATLAGVDCGGDQEDETVFADGSDDGNDVVFK